MGGLEPRVLPHSFHSLAFECSKNIAAMNTAAAADLSTLIVANESR